MFTRRSVLGVTALGMASATAGCVSQLPFIGDEELAFTASPAVIPDSVLDETGYDEQELDELVIEESFEAGGQEQDVRVTNWQAEYDKSIELGGIDLSVNDDLRAAVCSVLSTPQVNVLGRSFNPVADMSTSELADMAQDRFDDMDGLEPIDETSLTILGDSTTVTEFEGEAELLAEGVTVDLTLHIAEAVEAGDDLVVGVGGYPTQFADEERENVLAMLEGIVHEE